MSVLSTTQSTATCQINNAYPDLDYDADYSYVAFVTTSEGETFYGETKSFHTGEDMTGIEPMAIDNGQRVIEESIYDLNGRKLSRMQKGVNIVRMKDGTTRKVFL